MKIFNFITALVLSIIWGLMIPYNVMGILCSRKGAPTCDEGALGLLIISILISILPLFMLFSFLLSKLKGKAYILLILFLIVTPIIVLVIQRQIVNTRLQNAEKSLPSKMQVDYTLTPNNSRDKGYELAYSVPAENATSDSNVIYHVKWDNYKLGSFYSASESAKMGVVYPDAPPGTLRVGLYRPIK